MCVCVTTHDRPFTLPNQFVSTRSMGSRFGGFLAISNYLELSRRCLGAAHPSRTASPPATHALSPANEALQPSLSAPTHRPAARDRTGNSDGPPNIARTAEERVLPHIKGGFLLDVFAGILAPISAAADKQGLSLFEAFDLEANSVHDILDDACFELLMRISWSGIVSLITLAPPCKECSRLKLRPAGPKLQPACTACLACLPKKHRGLRKAGKSTGGAENSSKQLPHKEAWQSLSNRPRAWHGSSRKTFSASKPSTDTLAWVDACQHGMSFAKSWCFASNNPCIQHVAARCNHPKKHASIAGVRSTSGQFLSALTAEYPATLAASLVTAGTRASKTLRLPTDSKSVMEPACVPPQTIQYPSPVTRWER